MNTREANLRPSERFRIITKLALALTLTMVFGAGCDNNEITNVVFIDEAPPKPQGVATVRGDGVVTIYWLPVDAPDLDHYRIYWGPDSTDGTVFELVGTSATTSFVDTDVSNGVRYFYAVTAVDLSGKESAQSAEWGGATPRPEGTSSITSFDINSLASGFDFSTGSIVPFNSIQADIWLDRDIDGNLYLNADSIAPLGDIQDMGFTESFDEISVAPADGWSILRYYEVILGHTYVIWTGDLRYAKLRVTDMNSQAVSFDWAYQTAESQIGGDGEPELAPIRGDKLDRESGAHRTDTSQSPKNTTILSEEESSESVLSGGK